MIEARIEIEWARRSGAGNLSALPLNGEEDRDRWRVILREGFRAALMGNAADDPSSESLGDKIEHVYHS